MTKHQQAQRLMIVLLLCCITIGCGSMSNISVASSTLASDNHTTILQPTKTPELGTSRFNPAPLNSEFVDDYLKISVIDLIRPADQLVKDGDMFNPTPEADKEYLCLKIKVTCDRSPDKKCSFTTYDFKIVDSLGNVDDNNPFIMGVDNLLEGSEMFGGASEEGTLFFIVNKNEQKPVLMYEPIFGNSFFIEGYINY